MPAPDGTVWGVLTRFPRLATFVAALALIGASCGGDDTAIEVPAADADRAATSVGARSWPHTFVAGMIGGGQLDDADLAGQDVVLWFWAPW